MSRTGTTCRGCGALIRFVQTQAGKWLPCDPSLVGSEDLDDGDKLVTEDGRVITVGKSRDRFDGYLPHWVMCPNADDFRNKR